ncbi:MAG: cell wall hydrolase [Alphaproteobacteria bacterium]
MKLRIAAAHRRSDCALIFAVVLAFLASIPGMQANLYRDQLPSAQAAVTAIVTDSPVEQALAALTSEQMCLAEAMYYEALSEGPDGQKAVAEVILQRMQDRNYPKTICEIVRQGAERRTGCQFSYTCDGSLKRPKNAVAWRRVRSLAGQIMEGAVRLGSLTGRATHFHTVNVQPLWASELVRTTQIGNHIFYRRGPARGS